MRARGAAADAARPGTAPRRRPAAPGRGSPCARAWSCRSRTRRPARRSRPAAPRGRRRPPPWPSGPCRAWPRSGRTGRAPPGSAPGRPRAAGTGWVAVTTHSGAPGVLVDRVPGAWRTSSGWPSRTWTQAARRPSPAGHSATSTVGQAAIDTGQRGWNGQPRGRSPGSGGSPPQAVGRAARGRVADGRERLGQGPACRGGRGASNTVAAGPSSTIRPAYMTAIRSQVEASTDRSWVISSRARPSSRRSSSSRVEHLGLDHHVQGGGRLVGDQQAGASRPGPWRSSPAGAGRRTARGGSWAPAGRGRPTCSSSSPTRAWRPACRSPCSCSWMASAIWSPTRRTGLRACMAPWNTIAASVQRTARSRPRPHGEHVLALQQHAARRPGPRRQQAQDGRGHGRLAAARLAGQAQRLARVKGQVDPAHRRHRARPAAG